MFRNTYRMNDRRGVIIPLTAFLMVRPAWAQQPAPARPLVEGGVGYAGFIDETLVNHATVSGSASDLKWNSTTSTAWDLSSSNWLNAATSGTDRFFQGDSVSFDDSAGLQAGITLPGAVFPKSITVNSSTRNYSITGIGQIG